MSARGLSVNCACAVADDPSAGLIFELVVPDCRRVANRLKPAHGQTLRGHFYFVVDQDATLRGRERDPNDIRLLSADLLGYKMYLKL